MKRARSLVLLAVVSAVAIVPAARALSARPATTEPTVILDVVVTITDAKLTLSETAAERGEGVNFHVTNTGRKAHNFVLQGQGPIGLSNLGLSTRVIAPKKTVVLQVYMDYRGSFTVRSTVRADLAKPGMKSTFTVS